MPPKRKFVADHPNVTLGRAKIARRANGKQVVDQAVRNNVLLYLENLKDDEAKNYSQVSFQSKLSSAVSGALDPQVGPESFIDFSKYRPDLPAAFGNKQAGQLMSLILGMDDDQRLAALQKVFDEQTTKLEGEQANRELAEKTLAYLQELIPLSQDGKRDLPKDLENLEAIDPTGDSAWLYGILWTSCLQWMDTRLRQLRAFSNHQGNIKSRPTQPPGLRERTFIINNRVHGGDLRADALMGSIHFGEYRHHDVHYDTFIKESFKKMYLLNIDEGLWLAKNGQEISQGVDWPRTIGFIDKFVAMADRVNTWFGQDLPKDYKTVIDDKFAPLTKHVSGLINKARADPDWNASAQETAQLSGLQNQVYFACKGWKAKGDKKCLWDSMGDEPNYWAHAGYLRDEGTKQTRNTTQANGTRKLRPQVRINYRV